MKRIVFLAVLLLPSLAMAATILTHNTGVNGADALVAAGAQVSFWTLSAKPAGAVEPIGGNPFRFNCCYFADTASAAWVAPQANGNAGAGGFYTYDLVISLAGLDPATAVITGNFGTDNDGSISVNGNAPAKSTGFGDFGAPTAFTINSGFVAGSNTIHVKVDNGGDPTAFFVQFTSATASPVTSGVPEPATILLTCAGLAGLFFTRRRRA